MFCSYTSALRSSYTVASWRSFSTSHKYITHVSCHECEVAGGHYSGGPSWRSQNCLCFAGLEMGSRKLATFTSMRARHCKAPKTSLAGFRGLPRPSEASLMEFRGLPRSCEASTKSQNPFSLQDYEASGTRAYIILYSRGRHKASGPDEPWLPLFFRLCRILGRSWLQVPFILERGLKRLKMILQTIVILADASFTFRFLHGPRPR